MLDATLRERIAGVAFDAVGTLIEPTPSVATAYAEAAARQGVTLDRAEVKRRFVLHFRHDEVDDLKGPLATDEELERRRWRRIVSNVMPELSDPDRAFAELWDHFGGPTAWRVFPDVPEALALLDAAGIPCLVASNFDARLRPVLAGLPGLETFVETAVISSLVGWRKPHPNFYRAVLDRLDLPPERVLYIGDDPTNDVEGPRRAGLAGISVEAPGGERRLLPLVAALVGRSVQSSNGSM